MRFLLVRLFCVEVIRSDCVQSVGQLMVFFGSRKELVIFRMFRCSHAAFVHAVHGFNMLFRQHVKTYQNC